MASKALFALSTNHEAWRELTLGYKFGWDTAEDRLTDALARAPLAHQPQQAADKEAA